MEQTAADEYWNRFLSQKDYRSTYGNRVHPAWYFCNNQKDADELLELVLQGIKRGTASLEESYAWENEVLPVAGDLSIITNWAGVPGCIIETIKVTRCSYDEITPELAAIEGEGDGSLAYWRKSHEKFFSEELAEQGKEFHPGAAVVFEEFRVIYR